MNSKYDKVHIDVPADVLLVLDKQRRFKSRESFVTTNLVEMKGYELNGKNVLFRELFFHNTTLRSRPKETTRLGATNKTDGLTH